VKLGLKVDVRTYRGTRDGVPRLVELLQKHEAGATFFFSVGPDHTGRAVRRLFQPGALARFTRASLARHYGLAALLYGTLLPGPDIGRRCADAMRAARDAGFECGIHAWDRMKWQNGAARAGLAWTERQMRRARERFESIFGVPAGAHGAAGWQMNWHAYRLTQRLGFDYASDTRGSEPFIPIHRAEIVACPQIPTTLPTLDELIGLDGVTADSVAERVLALTGDPPPTGHVFTLHAELEGRGLAPAFGRLLEGWKAQGYELVPLRAIYESLDPRRLPRCNVAVEAVPGRSGILAVQGAPFLA